MASYRKLRILFVQDNLLQRDCGLLLFNARKDITAAGVEVSVDKVRQAIRRFKPKVVAIGTGMLDPVSVDIVHLIRAEFPETGIVVLDLTPGSAHVLDFLKAGVSGFVDGNSSFAELLTTIRAVARGRRVFPQALPESVISQIFKPAVPDSESAVSRQVSPLTGRQKDIVRLISKGYTNKQIGEKLCLSVHTVKSHIHSIISGQRLHSRVEIVRFSQALLSAELRD